MPSGSASGTLRPEWQCDGYARDRVAVRITLPLAGERTEAERSGPSGSATGAPGYAQARVAVRPVRSGSSGSATGTSGYAQARVAVQVTLPSGVERTVAVRSGSSGSATGTFGPEWQCGSHCHSLVNVQGLSVQCRVAVRPVCSGVVWPRMSGSALDLSRGWPFTRGISWQAGRFLNELVKLVCSAPPTCNGYGSR